MRVGIVTQYYPPDPPAWIPGGLARELARRGHEVRVLTTFPHYETGSLPDGYKQSLHHIEQDGAVPVRRVPLFASHSSNAFARMANYVSVATSMRMARGFLRDVDVIYVYGTPMTVADPARVWARSLDIPYVLHVQDLWPESVTGSGILPGRLARVASAPLNWWLTRVYRSAARTIAIAPSMREMLVQRGVPAERAVTIFNWSDDADEIVPNLSSSSAIGLRLVYAGNLGRMQDLETIVRALAEVRDLEGTELAIAGSGVLEDDLRKLVGQLAVPNVRFLGRLSADEVARLYAQSDFQFVTLKDLAIFDGTVPSKFQAGIANALPAISTVRGDLRTLIETHRLGFTAAPEDPSSLAAAIRLAYATTADERVELRGRSRAFYENEMSKSSAIDGIEEQLKQAVATKAPVKS